MPKSLLRRVAVSLILVGVVAMSIAGCVVVPFPVFDGGHRGHSYGHEHRR